MEDILRKFFKKEESLGCSDKDALMVIKRTPNNKLVAACQGTSPEKTTPIEVALWALNKNPDFWSKSDLGRSILDTIRREDANLT
jgi:hypothetical protein